MSKKTVVKLADLKKGDTVILHMFTGIGVGVKEVLKADKATVTLETRKGEAKFSRKTGKQVEPEAKSEKYANFITEDDGSFVPTNRKKKDEEKSAKKANSKKAKAEVEDDDDDEEEVKPSKKAKKEKEDKKAAGSKKKSKKVVEEDDDDDDDEYEELDD